MRKKIWILGGLFLALSACGGAAGVGGAKAGDASGAGEMSKRAVSKQAKADFDRALQSFLDHDRKQDWNEGICSSVAGMFEGASEQQKSATGRGLAEAAYNAGLAYQRCGKDAEAQAQFEAAAGIDSRFHRAQAQLALYKYQQSGDLDGTISRLDELIREAKFQNAEALVSLAALQMERGNDQADGDGKDDFERAQRNLQRALAVDDSYMPAFNQLAVYYLEAARKKAGAGAKSRRGARGMEVSGASRTDVNEQQLDLAALVASQAQRKNPSYAPIHNTTGLIQSELKNFNGAVKSFGRARQLDPKFFEAHMNYAAVNLSFRGFQEAEKAYREALKLRPKEYEAYLGLALAVRGQINDSNFDTNVNEAQKVLDQAKKLDVMRPEAVYNEAILTHEFRAKRAGNKAVPVLQKAASQYQDFVTKAGDDPVMAAAVKRSKERIEDIQATIKFLKEGDQAERDAEEARKAAEAQKKIDDAEAKKAAEEQKKLDEAAGKKAAEEKKKTDDAAAQKAAEAQKKIDEAAAKKAAAEQKKADAAAAKKAAAEAKKAGAAKPAAKPPAAKK